MFVFLHSLCSIICSTSSCGTLEETIVLNHRPYEANAPMGRRANNKGRMFTEQDAQPDHLFQAGNQGDFFSGCMKVTVKDSVGKAVVTRVRDISTFNPLVGYDGRFIALDTTDDEYLIRQHPKLGDHPFPLDDGSAAADVDNIDAMSSLSTADSEEPGTTTHEVIVERVVCVQVNYCFR
ncbi:MAG: hypothetical protein LQ342_005589 [Letrouitia transgressa]|nr:MAG: hypothetical protein LQ342_005589 [Letrouitia transgressa]